MVIPGVTNIDDVSNNVSSAAQTLGQEDFMNLLLQELSYQDPLKPMDSKEFTVQLSQFSSLERLKDIDDTLNDVLAFQQSMQNATVTNLLGKSVNVGGNSSYLNGTADMSYDLAAKATSVKILIYDPSGKMVRSEELGAQEAGGNLYSWDGKDDLGNEQPDGSYTFEIEAMDDTGNPVEAATVSSGQVTGVVYDNDITYLVLDGSRNVYLSDVQSVGL
ncbi:MAG TPA: flagellar hook assembly protein FlgD [Nitrospirae bacterium]|nr:basal-body rod modification protein FlgD [bacterium BMS3Abin06]HDH13208.1 flagellar hook assembly protein FlgD [Nitrospirota bacterium]HDZ01824.1 flagellar hook assembly protein FlgD [Nitrospirota bacterium]